MKIYHTIAREEQQIMGIKCYEGETIEVKVARILEDKEPISEISERIYGTREEGVKAETNIRTDKWDIAVEAMDAANKSKIAKREDAINTQKIKDQNEKDRKDKETNDKIAAQVRKGMQAEGLNNPTA
nr:MAG: hypothetical protein [Microviridae sp.]